LADQQGFVAGVGSSDAAAPAATPTTTFLLLRAFLDLTPDAALAVDRNGSIVAVNELAERLFDYPSGALVGQAIEILVPERVRAHHEEHRAGYSRSASKRPMGAGLQLTGRTRTGDEFAVDISLAPVVGDGDHYVVAAVRDMSERKAVETELRRLLADEERLQRQHAATSEIRLALLANSPLDQSLELVCQRAAELLHAPVAFICIRESEGARLMSAVGPAADMTGSLLPLHGSLAGEVVDTGRPIEVAHRSDRSTVIFSPGFPDGPALGVPIIAGGEVSGALEIIRADEAAGYNQADRVIADGLAAQAALALELEEARSNRERIVLVSERERIARDLHDLVIQRLYAAGMSLQATIPLSTRPAVQERIAEAVESLDETIRDIRNTIFTMNKPDAVKGLLRSSVLELADESRETLGFSPSVHFEGPVDSIVPESVVPHVLAVVREALSNAARHASATYVAVRVAVDSSRLVVEVTDDGIGIGASTRSSGLSNLEERASSFGGEFDVRRAAERGTRLTWEVPLGDKAH
jgi:PAS domain S-box-containing protein